MQTLLIAVIAGVAFIVAYHTYGRWLGSKIFRLSADAICPSTRLEDGADYVPTAKPIVFGHHFTSIAGTGPIVGPAIAVLWGWLPALLWVVLGSIFIGAVHDFGALVVSLRNNGQTVGDIAGRVLNKRVRLLFLLVLVMALTIVLAIFGWVIAKVFQVFPMAIFPCVIQIPIAVAIGILVHRRGRSILVPSIVALVVMYLTVIFGDVGFLHTINEWMASWPIILWVAVLLLYSYVASVLPVWTLLQPRDYINSLQLITALGLIVVGLFAAAMFGGPADADGARQSLSLATQAVRDSPVAAPMMYPFLFITIACGAISGFHCLVSSGTSSKQLEKEPDARFIGYGGMLTEGFLATLVILACVAGLGLGVTVDGQALVGAAAFDARYESWAAVKAGAVGSFVLGASNILQSLSIPAPWATALMGVLVASFAGTTLDTACRLQRYVIQELAATVSVRQIGEGGLPQAPGAGPLSLLRNKHGATICAVAVAVVLAAIPSNGVWATANLGTGGLILWPLFGATNQLLGGLAFLVVSFYLWRRGIPVWFLVLPMIFMLIMPAWAMLVQVPTWAEAGQWVLVTIAVLTLLLEAWMIIEAVMLWPRVKGVVEPDAIDAATGTAASA